MIPYSLVMSIGLDMIYTRACTDNLEVMDEIQILSQFLLLITKEMNQPAATDWSEEEIEL